MLVEHRHHIARRLSRRVGVEVAADLFHLQLKVNPASALGAFEMQVLQEMGGSRR